VSSGHGIDVAVQAEVDRVERYQAPPPPAPPPFKPNSGAASSRTVSIARVRTAQRHRETNRRHRLALAELGRCDQSPARFPTRRCARRRSGRAPACRASSWTVDVILGEPEPAFDLVDAHVSFQLQSMLVKLRRLAAFARNGCVVPVTGAL
jgi:hypothetical protein